MSRLTSEQARARQEFKAALNLVDCCQTGYWLCPRCQEVVPVDDGPVGYQVCAWCQSPRVRRHPPIFPNHEKKQP